MTSTLAAALEGRVVYYLDSPELPYPPSLAALLRGDGEAARRRRWATVVRHAVGWALRDGATADELAAGQALLAAMVQQMDGEDAARLVRTLCPTRDCARCGRPFLVTGPAPERYCEHGCQARSNLVGDGRGDPETRRLLEAERRLLFGQEGPLAEAARSLTPGAQDVYAYARLHGEYPGHRQARADLGIGTWALADALRRMEAAGLIEPGPKAKRDVQTWRLTAVEP